MGRCEREWGGMLRRRSVDAHGRRGREGSACGTVGHLLEALLLHVLKESLLGLQMSDLCRCKPAPRPTYCHRHMNWRRQRGLCRWHRGARRCSGKPSSSSHRSHCRRRANWRWHRVCKLPRGRRQCFPTDAAGARRREVLFRDYSALCAGSAFRRLLHHRRRRLRLRHAHDECVGSGVLLLRAGERRGAGCRALTIEGERALVGDNVFGISLQKKKMMDTL